MRYVVWTIRLIIFIAVLLFAYHNVTPVDVVFYDGVSLSNVPLIVVLLVTFVIGAVFGAILMMPGRWRRWRESGRLRKDLSKAKSSSRPATEKAAQGSSATSSDVAPL